MKLISTEIDASSIQLTYTDGRAVPEAKEYLIVRRPFDGDPHKSLAWNQLRVMSELAKWADEERRRIRDEIETNG
jgi:hypothetical protein